MDDEERLARKIRDARRLRDVPPEVTLRMGFSMMRFAAELREAGDRALAEEE